MAELNDKLVKSYIEILELMFIVRRVPSYLKNRAKRLAARMPKIHYVDTGLACHLLGLKNEDQLLKSQYYGGLLENLFYTGQEILPFKQGTLTFYALPIGLFSAGV